MENEVYDVKAAARRLGISKQGLYRLTAQRLIEHYRPSPGRVVFSEEQILRYLARHEQAPVG